MDIFKLHADWFAVILQESNSSSLGMYIAYSVSVHCQCTQLYVVTLE